MKTYLFGLMATLLMLACSCSPLRSLSRQPAAKMATLLERHPELIQPETVQVRVPFAVPEVRFERSFYPVHDTIYLQRERTELDSLIRNLTTSLDSAQSVATKAKLQQLLLSRPVLRDTLCFDTLGVRGRIWLADRVYKLEIVRDQIRDTITGPAVVGKLALCPPLQAPAYPWFDPAGWALPWWLWLLMGAALGTWLGCYFCISLMRRPL